MRRFWLTLLLLVLLWENHAEIGDRPREDVRSRAVCGKVRKAGHCQVQDTIRVTE